MKILKLVVASMLLSLVACAPAATGSQVSVPLVAASTLAPAPVKAGQTLYVQYTYPNATVGVSDDLFDDPDLPFEPVNAAAERAAAAQGYGRPSQRAAGWLSMKASGLPEGWQLTLVQAYLVKVPINASSTRRYYPQVQVVYRVTAPADARTLELARLQFFDHGRAVGTALLMLGSEFGGPGVKAGL
jgi:hypothetical protein